MTDIYAFLQSNAIEYQRFDHPAVYTCKEAERLCPEMPGVPLKNLFLRDKNATRHFLAVVGYGKNVDLKKLKELLGVSKLGFASPDRLQQYLGVEPGAVTLLGLINDADRSVEVLIDEQLRDKAFQCHPLVNTATLVISPAGILKFFEVTGHTVRFLEIPGRA